MATQERKVYAGLAVVIGGLMPAYPRFLAKVMGGACRSGAARTRCLLFGADDLGAEVAGREARRLELPRRDLHRLPGLHDRGQEKILGLNAAKLYDVEVPAELQLADGRRR